jgi:hypothetical protein
MRKNPVLLLYDSPRKRPPEENINRTNRATTGINHFVGNDVFPTEIFYIILEFYTNSWKGLLTFKTICQNWKYIGETSLIWLSCKLEFSAPRAYRVFMPSHNPRNEVQVLSIGMIESKFPTVVQVKIDRSRQDELSPSKIPLERAKACHDCFIGNLRGYNRAWASYIRCKRFSGRMVTILKPILVKTLIFSFSFGALFSFPAVYLLENISISSSLSIKQQMGFFCLYLMLVSYLPSRIVSLLRQTFLHLGELSSPFLEIEVRGHRVFIITYVQLTFLIFLIVHLKFTSYPEIPWTITTIPLWVMIFLVMVKSYLWALDEMNINEALGLSTFLGSLMIITVLPLTLVGYSYDNDSNNSNLQLKYMSIFYYPHAVALTALMFYSIYNVIGWLQRRGYVRPAGEDQRMGYLRFFLFSGSMICYFASCVILFILLVSVWMQSPSFFFILTNIPPVGLLFLLFACLHVSFATDMLEKELDYKN